MCFLYLLIVVVVVIAPGKRHSQELWEDITRDQKILTETNRKAKIYTKVVKC